MILLAMIKHHLIYLRVLNQKKNNMLYVEKSGNAH